MGNLLNSFGLRKYQVNPEGGMIFVDRKVEKWLDSFKKYGYSGKSEIEIDLFRKITKSGFEDDQDVIPPRSLPKISLVLVTYNSDFWMDNLNKMFSNLGEWLSEIIVVDNGSIDNCVERLNPNEKISIIKNEIPKSFAAAVNQGCRIANGDLYLIINPDVFIPKSALFSLINFYLDHPDAGAIVPKLMLMSTPGFINGVGNIVPFFRWGYDLGLGHLDVGQFDDMLEVPSACFATVLIPKTIWGLVGELDEDYPMYYEDSDWSYQLRISGNHVFVDPKSKIYHAFGGSLGKKKTVSNRKILFATYGRLRLINKLFPKQIYFFYILSYLLFDIIFLLYSVITFNMINIQMVCNGWKKFLNEAKIIKQFRHELSANPKILRSLQNQFNQKTYQPNIYFGNPIINSHLLSTYKSKYLKKN